MQATSTVPASTASSFPARLVAAQERVGIGTEALARRLDLSVRVVQKWRSGETEPNGRNLVRLAGELGVRPESLFGDDIYESGHRGRSSALVAENPTQP